MLLSFRVWTDEDYKRGRGWVAKLISHRNVAQPGSTEPSPDSTAPAPGATNATPESPAARPSPGQSTRG